MKPRLLFISSRPIFPIVGGDQIRTAQQLELLIDLFYVDVVYISQNDVDENIHNHLPEVGKVVKFKVSKIKSYFNTLKFIFNRLPLQVNYYYDSKVASYIDDVAQSYDAIFCNLIRTAPYANNLKILKYLDFVDAISMNYEKARKKAFGLKRLIYSLDYKRCKDYEKKCLQKFDRCAIISDIDNQYIVSDAT